MPSNCLADLAVFSTTVRQRLRQPRKTTQVLISLLPLHARPAVSKICPGDDNPYYDFATSRAEV